jgi:hypothetical protein
MKSISRSPNRHTFQRDAYIRRCEEEGKEPQQEYLDLMDSMAQNHLNRFGDKTPENDLEYDLLTTPWILEKARASKSYAQNIYAALCNQDWQKIDVMPILKDETWGCSWRSAGGIVADMLGEGDYIDWYCSGIRNDAVLTDYEFNNLTEDQQKRHKETEAYVPEGCVTDEIREDFFKLGWQPVDNDEDI